jgi:receptor protein-tyrosine kinase
VELSGYLAVARRWWWTLIVSAWIAGLAGYLVASGLPPTYESQVKVLVGPINTDTDTLRASASLVQTYAQVVTTESVLSSAIKELGLSMNPADLRTATRATANDVTRILTIRVQAADRELAAKLANALATELEQLTSQGVSRPEGLIQVVEFAQPSSDPVAPQVSLIAILAAFAGVIVAIVVVLLIEYFGRTIRTREELAAVANAPVLGAVSGPVGDRPAEADLVVDLAPDSRAAAAYRMAAAVVAFIDRDRPVRSMVVTDVDWEGQAAVVASNLASALARLGRPVILIDGAGPRGSVTQLHRLAEQPGLAEILANESTPNPGTSPSAGVRILPAGKVRADVVDPVRLRALLAQLTGAGATVIVAAAPIKDAPQTLTWTDVTDGVILVGRRDRTHREDVQFAAESVRLVDRRLIGVMIVERSRLRGRGRSGRSGAPARPNPRPLALEPVAAATPTLEPRDLGATRPSPVGSRRRRPATGLAASDASPGSASSP